jgi:hypothetical protein
MTRARWFFSATFWICLIAHESARADLLIEIASGGIRTGDGLFGVDANFGNLFNGPGVVPPTAVFSENAPITGTASGVVSFSSAPGENYALGASMQESLTGGPSSGEGAPTLSAGATVGYKITPDPPYEKQWFYFSVHAEILGHLAPGDSLSYEAIGSMGLYGIPTIGGMGTITTPGDFLVNVETHKYLFGFEFGDSIVNYPDSPLASLFIQAAFTKGAAGGKSYVNFDPTASLTATNSPIPEPSSCAMFATGTLVVAGIGILRGRVGTRG